MSLKHVCSQRQKLQLSSKLQPTWNKDNRLSGSPHGEDKQLRAGADKWGDLNPLQSQEPEVNIMARREWEWEILQIFWFSCFAFYAMLVLA